MREWARFRQTTLIDKAGSTADLLVYRVRLHAGNAWSGREGCHIVCVIDTHRARLRGLSLPMPETRAADMIDTLSADQWLDMLKTFNAGDTKEGATIH